MEQRSYAVAHRPNALNQEKQLGVEKGELPLSPFSLETMPPLNLAEKVKKLERENKTYGMKTRKSDIGRKDGFVCTHQKYIRKLLRFAYVHQCTRKGAECTLLKAAN